MNNNSKMSSRYVRAGSAAALVLAATVLTAAAGSGNDTYASLPASFTLTGVIRDFRKGTATGGHPDFELDPTGGFAAYQQECQDTLDSDGKPVFRSTGKKVNSDWKDSSGRAMMQPRSVHQRHAWRRGQFAVLLGRRALDQFEPLLAVVPDVPGVNLSMPLNLTLVRQAGTNTYTFNDRTDSHYAGLGGFFPINGELLGNSGGSTPNQNFHFTFELSTTFRYAKGTNQVFNLPVTTTCSSSSTASW